MNTLTWDQIETLTPEEELPPGFKPLTELAPIIMVGLTGVGKTTVLGLLAEDGLPLTLLPNRREITDKVMIASLQAEAGQAPHPVTDRLARFEYTARYRAKRPGGMAYALSQLALSPAKGTTYLFFDGLRGQNEVEYATAYFPQVRFVILDAPDLVRLRRLLKRGDAFDVVTAAANVNDNLIPTLNQIPHLKAVFSQNQVHQLIAMTQADRFPVDELLDKVSIIVKERHNYDSQAAHAYLTQTLPPDQVLVIDTAHHPPATVVKQIRRWLEGSVPNLGSRPGGAGGISPNPAEFAPIS